jgi:hypothetical protein
LYNTKGKESQVIILTVFRSRYLVVWYAIILHLIQGSLMVASETAGFVTSTSHVIDWSGMLVYKLGLSFSVSAQTIGIIYILIALSSLIGLAVFERYSFPRLLSLIPQQVFLTLAAMGAAVAIMDSAFADGVVRSRYFIGADQSPIIIAAVLHSWIMIEGRIDLLNALTKYERNVLNGTVVEEVTTIVEYD